MLRLLGRLDDELSCANSRFFRTALDANAEVSAYLREHYVLTLQHWISRLERCQKEATEIVGDATYRVWRLYMTASMHGFATGRLNVLQTLLAKPDNGRAKLPLTRQDLYQMI